MSCPDCFSGHVHDGTPKGQIVELHGLTTYVSEPTNGAPAKGIIVIIPDAFGMEFVNNKLLADTLSQKGQYKVYLPDFVNGTSAPPWTVDAMANMMKMDTFVNILFKPYHIACVMYSMVPFLIRNRFSNSWPTIQSFFQSLRENEAAHLPLGAAGYCWGGKHTVVLAHGSTSPNNNNNNNNNGKPLIDAGFAGHPSGLSLPGDIEKITKPVSFAIGDQDELVSPAQIERIRGIVEAKVGGARGEVRSYRGAGHGFCVRADRVHVVGAEARAVEAEDQLLSWFGEHFGKVDYGGGGG